MKDDDARIAAQPACRNARTAPVNWDHLRIFLELSRTQNLVEAARRLGIDHSTVSRRMRRFEEEVGTQLFDRQRHGHALTPAGQSLLEYAERIESTMAAATERLGGQNRALSGHVRVGATEGFGTMFLAPQLSAFCASHPHISVDLITMPRLVNLTKREADIVVSIERPTAGSHVTAKLSDHLLMIYGTRAYLDAHPPIRTLDDLRGHRFIGYVDELLFSAELQYRESLAPESPTNFRSTGIMGQYTAALAGHGLAILPSFLACGTDELVPVLEDTGSFRRSFWLVAERDRRNVARIAALWTYLREAADMNRDFLLGRTRHMRMHPDPA